MCIMCRLGCVVFSLVFSCCSVLLLWVFIISMELGDSSWVRSGVSVWLKLWEVLVSMYKVCFRLFFMLLFGFMFLFFVCWVWDVGFVGVVVVGGVVFRGGVGI